MEHSEAGEIATLLRRFETTELAEKMELAYSTVYRWQWEGRIPRRTHLARLSRVTGIPIEKLREARQADRLAARA